MHMEDRQPQSAATGRGGLGTGGTNLSRVRVLQRGTACLSISEVPKLLQVLEVPRTATQSYFVLVTELK